LQASDIIVTKKDEVYAKITCERHVAMELSQYFTFMVPGYQFTPAFRNKIWDGKIRLFNLQTSQIYLGLLDYIKVFCEEREYTMEHNLVEDEFSLYHAKKFAESLNIHSQGIKLTVNDHQLDAFVDGMQSRRRLLVSPTSSGKSLIAYLFFRQFNDFQNLKGLMIVPSTSLVEQMTSDFTDYSSHNGFDVEENVHKIYDYKGMVKQTDKALTISTWQSLYKMPKEYFEQFDYIIGDEAHLFKAQSLTTILTSLVNTKYRIGMTGTLDGTKTHKLVLEGLFGAARQVITTKELMEQGKVADFKIKCLVLKHPDEACELYKKATYQEELQYLMANESRNKFIRNLALSMEKNTLVLFQMVEKHGQIIYDMIRTAEKLNGRNVYFIHGKVDTDDREVVRSIMEKEKNAIVVASYGTFSTGTNIRNLHNIIFASPSKSRVRNLQSIGRGLRLSKDKETATLYDIADDMRSGKNMNFTLRHFVERVKIYNEEKFSFKMYNIGLKDGKQ
jgi:superfamily II DNA or RNA helicase